VNLESEIINQPIERSKMNLLTNIADDINRHHQIAIAKADEAVEHALAAGKLLLEVKTSLPHGKFGAWLQASVDVSSRQAQRYMAVAKGKPIPIRAISSKYDTVSYLSDESDKWTPRPVFIPLPSQCYAAGQYVVEPSKDHPGYFFVSHMLETAQAVDCTHRPVMANWVESQLKHFGLDAPELTDWRTKPCQGVAYALETFGMAPPEIPSWHFEQTTAS
jgi:hypothetical protein